MATTIKLQQNRIVILKGETVTKVKQSDVAKLRSLSGQVTKLDRQIRTLVGKQESVYTVFGRFLVALAKQYGTTKEQTNQIVFLSEGGRTNALAFRVSTAWKAAGVTPRNKGKRVAKKGSKKTAPRSSAPRRVVSPTVRAKLTMLARTLAKKFDLKVKAAYTNGRFSLVLTQA